MASHGNYGPAPAAYPDPPRNRPSPSPHSLCRQGRRATPLLYAFVLLSTLLGSWGSAPVQPSADPPLPLPDTPIVSEELQLLKEEETVSIATRHEQPATLQVRIGNEELGNEGTDWEILNDECSRSTCPSPLRGEGGDARKRLEPTVMSSEL